jgi:hydroxyacylglutathione hydrolase
MPTIIPIPAFTDNYIWLLREGTHAAVVDPGDAAPVLAHHHKDHVGGVTALLARYSVPVFGPAREVIPGRTQAMAEGDEIMVPGPDIAMRVLDIPGHTAGHIAFVGRNGGAPVAFVGDTLFAAGCGRLFEGTPAQMTASLAKLAALPGETQVY